MGTSIINRSPPRASVHSEPSIGYESRPSVKRVAANRLHDGPSMRYEATAMGERVTQALPRPFQPRFSDGAPRAVRRAVRKGAPVLILGSSPGGGDARLRITVGQIR